jgi:large subunit ribosomal protein L10
MKREQKIQAVEEYVGIFEKPGIFLMDFKGLDVTEMTELRRKLREADVSLRVVKNTLAKRALDEAKVAGLHEYFAGPVGVAWAQDDVAAPARVILKFIKEHDKGVIKVGMIDGAVVTDKEIVAISKLPSKHELQAKVASALNAPLVSLARTVNALPQKLAMTVNALKAKKEEEANAA